MFLRRYVLVLALSALASGGWNAIRLSAGIGDAWGLVGGCVVVAVGTLYSVTYYVKLSEEGER